MSCENIGIMLNVLLILIISLFNYVYPQLKPGNSNLCGTNDVPYNDPFRPTEYRRCASDNGCPTGYYCTTGYCCPQQGLTCPGNVQPMISSVNNRPLPCNSGALCPISHYCRNGVCCPTQITRCTEPLANGNCNSYALRFWYNPRTQSCEEFLYSGCGGNNNNFLSLADCMGYCRNQIGAPTQVQIIYPNIINLGVGFCPAGDSLKSLTGAQIPCATSADCRALQTHYCYNGRCCPNQAYACSLAMDPGYCNSQVVRFYFSTALQTCAPFTWNGCGGNPNRFLSAFDCENYCRSGIVPSSVQNNDFGLSGAQFLLQSVFPSTCRIGYPEKDSNGKAVSCSSIDRCNNQSHQCINGWCCPRTEYVCTQPMISGSCSGSRYIPRWFFNSQARPPRCDSFIYTGCNGNDNSFATESDCQAFCLGGPISNGIVSNSILINNNVNFVTQQPGTSSGRCPGNDELNFHRVCVSDNDCTAGIENCYGGSCCPKRDVLCGFPKQRGTCSSNTNRWWFNRFSRRCEPFLYSGCFGNANNFSSRSECENFCRDANPFPV